MNGYTSVVWVTTVLCLVIQGTAALTDPIVQTEYGNIRGTLRYATGSKRPVYSYFGVKYGRSPDYVFRFQPPEDPWIWEGARNATDESRPMCMQDLERYRSLRSHTFIKHMMPDNPKMSEDCLILDIFTPVSPQNSAATSLPVIIWLHGGSFDAFASTTKLWALSAFEDVVLVQVQYRLGIFGFYTTHDQWAPANIGLHDQIKAMEWVARNIRNFSGNPNLVTLMGESAGSIAATAHMLMPSSVGLFHRVIALSGAPGTKKWEETYFSTAKRLGKVAECDFEASDAINMCLQNRIGTSTLMRYAKEVSAYFGLSEDNVLFPDKVGVLVNEGHFASKVPVMLSVTSGEANYILSRKFFPDAYYKGPKASRQELRQVLQNHLSSLYSSKTAELFVGAIVQEYMSQNSSAARFEGLLEAVADSLFVSKVAKFAQKLEDVNLRAYLMQFGVKPSMYDTKPDEYSRPFKQNSADHSDDIPYVFGFPFVAEFAKGTNSPMTFTPKEEEISKKYMHAIAHFAETGYPPDELKWPRYPHYLKVGDSCSIENGIISERRLHLWNDVSENPGDPPH